MPAAAVIPAPLAYIKVVAVKKLVVEFKVDSAGMRSLRLRCKLRFLPTGCIFQRKAAVSSLH